MARARCQPIAAARLPIMRLTLSALVGVTMLSPLPLLGQLPLTSTPICLRVTYDSLDSGIAVQDLPTRLELSPGDRRGNVRALDSSYADAKLRRGQEWSVSLLRDSSFEYMVILGRKTILLNYLLQLKGDSIRGSLAVGYIVGPRQVQNRHARVVAAIETCPT